MLRIRPFTPLVLLVVLTLASTSPNPALQALKTASVVLSDTSVLFVLAAGLTFVIMLGGIDLSVQAVASLRERGRGGAAAARSATPRFR